MSQANEEDSSGSKPIKAGRTRATGKRDKQSSDHTTGTPNTTGKGHKNDPFYVAKRGLFRKADGLVKRF